MKKLLLSFLLLSSLAKADTFTTEEKVYTTRTGSEIVMTAFICAEISNPDTLPLREAYITDGETKEKLTGCALEYVDNIEFQFFDEVKKARIELIIPIKNFTTRTVKHAGID